MANAFRVGVTASLLILASAVCQAQELKVGGDYRGHVELSKGLGGIVLPLPDGAWRLVDLEDSRVADVDYNIPVTSGAFVSLDLDRARRQVKSFIRYWIASTDSLYGGWIDSPVCSGAEHYYTYKSDQNRRRARLRCWSIKLETVKPSLQVPALLVSVTYFWSAGAKGLQATYYFNPETAGFPPLNADDWSRGGIAADPKRAQYIEDLKSWGASWQPRIEQGFSGKAPP